MINCNSLYSILKKYNFEFFTGVPDSTFKEWLKFLNVQKDLIHIPVSNEAEGIAVASGYYLSTRKIGIVYMQNSGLGNSVNPLTSLTDKEVYSIPLVLFIGWRGKPGEKDEPQHKKMGRITLPLLDVLEIPYIIHSDKEENLKDIWEKVYNYTYKRGETCAVIIPRGIFEKYNVQQQFKNKWELEREEAIKTIVNLLEGKEAIVSTTGKISRELYEYRDEIKSSHKTDFYTVGSLGCSLPIGLGIAISQKNRKVIVFDADGSAFMHLGAWIPVGAIKPSNLKHIIFDNECYESTGAQPSHSPNVDFEKIALAVGYKDAFRVKNKEELIEGTKKLLKEEGPILMVVKVKSGSRKDLGRPKTTPIENKENFMKFLQE